MKKEDKELLDAYIAGYIHSMTGKPVKEHSKAAIKQYTKIIKTRILHEKG